MYNKIIYINNNSHTNTEYLPTNKETELNLICYYSNKLLYLINIQFNSYQANEYLLFIILNILISHFSLLLSLLNYNIMNKVIK